MREDEIGRDLDVPGACFLAFRLPRVAPRPCNGCLYGNYSHYHNDDCHKDTPADKAAREISYQGDLVFLKERNSNA